MELNSMANRTNIAMKPYSTSPEALTQKPVNLRRRARPGEFIIQAFLFACGGFSILTTVGIVYVLGRESMLFFLSDEVSLREFFTNTRWQPQILEFGI
jgi:phosphate transport system permease protein